MKKAVAVLLTVVLLSLPVNGATVSPDVDFSVTDASGKIGESVELTVYMTKNPGIWSSRLTVHFDPAVLRLTDVSNGEVFGAGEFTKSVLTNEGYYIFYAQRESLSNNTNTGKLMTLKFEILPTSLSETEVFLKFPDNGNGWFFSADDPNSDYTVPDNGAVFGTVSISKNIRGDINSDGKINASDSVLIKKAIVGKAKENIRIFCDLDGDGKINVSDALTVRKLIVGKPV